MLELVAQRLRARGHDALTTEDQRVGQLAEREPQRECRRRHERRPPEHATEHARELAVGDRRGRGEVERP